MTAQAIRWESWTLAAESDRRFRRLLASLGVPFLIFAVVVPYLQLSGLKRGGGEVEEPRYVELLQAPPAPTAEKEEEPTPAPQEEKPRPETVKREAKPVPKKEAPPQLTQEQRVQQARAKAAKAMAWTNQLSGLASDFSVPSSTSPLVTAAPGANTGGTTSSVIAAAAGTTSGGIGETGSVQRAESGTGVGTRRTAKVEAPKGFSADPKRAGQGGDKLIAGRTLEEIQLVFERNKGSLYALYTRALREFPSMRGKVILRLTIAPNGTVTNCGIVSSELRNPELEKKIVQRVMLFNFGAKAVPPITIERYPVTFQAIG